METSPSSEFLLQFWGVRGSIPSPGKDTVRYGGNTSCIEMQIGGKRLIFDGGTGLRLLSKDLINQQQSVEAYMFFTHYHWDHIQGVPFFKPAFMEGNCFHIYGAVPPDADSMKQHFCDRVMHSNSPVPLQGMEADLKFYELICGDTFQVDDITIETGPLNHPNGAMGYRVTWQGHTVFYCTDTEHLPDRPDENVLHLAREADVLIYDAMYTDEEYNNPKSPKVGWGHSTWQEGVKVAQAAGVKRLAIFHHEPNHSDDFLDQIETQVQEVSPGSFLAREGMIVQVN
ncbi:MBL fold metallo-hydrolase [Coleofasciculus sp. FACHB-64]|uniref:MBL fold metallo-hydrolase n=1 Tax=Cyanophyceae TaxID=3028117 RepID=UPI001683FA56|nr:MULTISPECIES: MBL fold metallo-hydrolase [unclassified Coleofasciculus]MBD1839737.1 MBL fold metallo-hydrolase [Coleofasciculus sp. FACHB-501]MBD1896171.1 MBL fold metallo-hydrolase [Coleofasciculus sp. FACHB-129]MBD1902133.1 MBL fold metallo-hydrolase [Coleofasciculus sp. FACHB-125]MBD2046511.1 MBL fold metallo-hydrolase [Coleofasciculus sp. FACHB-64]MBD2540281.1 MBL fold metallo-hydrolase [Coleofasciculus sp. FACHB-SPT36]